MKASVATWQRAAALMLLCSLSAGHPALATPQDPQALQERLDDPPRRRDPRAGRSTPAPVLLGFPRIVQVNVDAEGQNILGDAANEPSIAFDPTAPDRLSIGWRQFDTTASNFRQAGSAYSRDGGRTWTNIGVLETNVFRSDPVLAADGAGNFYYYSLRSTQQPNAGCDMFVSSDGGQTWTNPIPAFGGDKAWMTIDRTGGIGDGNVYAVWSIFGDCCSNLTFTRSIDGGLTYSPPAALPLTPIWGTAAVGPDGELYISGRDPGNLGTFRVTPSINANRPFQDPLFGTSPDIDLGGPLVFHGLVNPAGLLGQVNVAVNISDGPARGDVYLLASVDPEGIDPLDVHIVRSSDGGATWTTPVRVNDDPPVIEGTPPWQWFGTMSVAPNGRIDVVWNDTRNDVVESRFSELYYAFSIDGGDTWSRSEPLSPPFDHFLGYPNQSKLGDYYHMVSDDVGAHLAWAATFNGEQDVYYLRIGDYDCNGNGIGDQVDLASGTSDDCDGNGIPDECEVAAGTAPPGGFACDDPADVNRDGLVNVDDLLEVILSWGSCPEPPEPCPADVDGDGEVGVDDLTAVILGWTF
jgi:hypothetical protein